MIIKLKDCNNYEILVNFDNVNTISYSNSSSRCQTSAKSVIYFMDGSHIEVIESVDDIIRIIEESR